MAQRRPRRRRRPLRSASPRSRWCRRRNRRPARSPARSACGRTKPAPSGSNTQGHVREPGLGEGGAKAHRRARRRDSPAKRTGRPTTRSERRDGTSPMQRREEARDQALERETPLVNARLGKTAMREIGLHRHDQAALERVVEVGLNRRRAGGVVQHAAARQLLVPETQDRAEHISVVVPSIGWRRAVTEPSLLQHGDDAVGRAEVDADGQGACGTGLVGRAGA